MHPWRSNEWLSPLSMLSIKSATQWVWKSPNNKSATVVNCGAALLQAHGHGPGVFQRIKNDINTALIKGNMPPVKLTWEEIDYLFFSTGLEFITDDLINQM